MNLEPSMLFRSKSSFTLGNFERFSRPFKPVVVRSKGLRETTIDIAIELMRFLASINGGQESNSVGS